MRTPLLAALLLAALALALALGQRQDPHAGAAAKSNHVLALPSQGHAGHGLLRFRASGGLAIVRYWGKLGTKTMFVGNDRLTAHAGSDTLTVAVRLPLKLTGTLHFCVRGWSARNTPISPPSCSTLRVR